MRCPNCGRFSKQVKVIEDDGESVQYSECSYCGRILLNDGKEKEDYKVEKRTDSKKNLFSEVDTRTDYVKVTFIILFVMTAGLSGYLYYIINQERLIVEDYSLKYLDLHDSHMELLNISTSLETYYREMQDMYSVLRGEYSNIEDSYTALMQEYVALQNEMHTLEDIVNLNESLLLEEDKTLVLLPDENITLSYDTSYAGYLLVNFTASSDVYIWIGSSVTENEYYARYPPYPNTAAHGAFTLPACAKVYINIGNPSEEVEVEVTLSIEYVY